MMRRHRWGKAGALRLLAVMILTPMLGKGGAGGDAPEGDVPVPGAPPRETTASGRISLPTLFGFGAVGAGASRERAADATTPDTATGDVVPEVVGGTA